MIIKSSTTQMETRKIISYFVLSIGR